LLRNLLSSVIAPIFVGIVVKLFEHWLDTQDKQNKKK